MVRHLMVHHLMVRHFNAAQLVAIAMAVVLPLVGSSRGSAHLVDGLVLRPLAPGEDLKHTRLGGPGKFEDRVARPSEWV